MEVVDQKQSANPNYVGNNGRPPPQDLPPKDEEEEATPPSSDNFSGTVERILTIAEPRESSPPFLAAEISSLSVLCSVQSSRKGLADDLGFADVDPDMTGQLVEYLVKHVAVASSIEVNKEAYSVIRKIKSQEVAFTIDQWIHGPGGSLIQTLRMGLEAASILLFIMTSPGIDRRVVNEEAIDACNVLFRNHLAKNILPSINNVGHIVNKATENTPSKKRRRSSTGSEAAVIRDMKKIYKHVFATVGLTVLVMERLDVLIQKIPLDDQQLLTMASGALLSLELDPANESSIQLSHQLHEATIGTVTAIFRKYPRHRQIIVEDLFPILLRMPISKKSMRTYPIQCSSVLYPSGLLSLSESLVPGSPNHHSSQLVQTITVVILSFVQSCVVRPLVQMVEPSSEDGSASTAVNQTPNLVSGLRDCQKISDLFVQLLLQRCSKKGEDGGASEFRPILSNLIDDLLLLLLVPEFPAAEMILLSIANRIMRDLILANKANQNAENTYLSTAFDALGKICAAEARILKYRRVKPMRLKTDVRAKEDKHVDCYCKKKEFSNSLMINCDKCNTWYYGHCVGISRETVPEQWYCDACQLGRIVEFERDRNTNMGEFGCSAALVDESYCMRRLLIDYLSIVSRKSGVVGVQDAYEFQVARSMSEIFANGRSKETDTLPLLARLMELWDPRESSNINSGHASQSLSGMLHCLSDEGRSRMVVHLATTQSSLLISFRRQVEFIVRLMSSESSALLRKLAVKAVEKITDADQKLMLYSFIKEAVTHRFSDEAISVREAAVSLVGSYVVHSPAVANAFHQAFMVGLNDSGVSVRKRTVKILQDILCSNPSYKGRAKACSEMLRLAADPKEDDGVRDLIYELFLKIWLQDGNKTVMQEIPSPVFTNSKLGERLKTPGPDVGAVEGTNDGPGMITPTSLPAAPFTPSPPKSARSSAKKLKTTRLQQRSEIAAEQMVEVVKQANTGENLTALFRELLSGVSDADKNRKSSERRKRKAAAKKQCSMLVDSLFEILLSVEEKRAENPTSFVKEIVAIMRTIRVFTAVSPLAVLEHLDTLLPYFKADNDFRDADEEVILSSLCDSLSKMATVFQKEDIERLGTLSLADDLVAITLRYGPEALSSAVRALCSLAHHQFADERSPFRTKLLGLAQLFYKYLFKYYKEKDLSTKSKKARLHIGRALGALGSVCRYHELSREEQDLMDEDDEEDEETLKHLSWSNLTAFCERMFTTYLDKNDVKTKCAALRALTGIFIARPREMLRMDQSGLITNVMSPDAPSSVQIESLRCWRDILLTEEARIESGEAKSKMDSKKSITLSKKISGDQDADATLFGGVLTNHAPRLFQMTQVRDKKIRYASLDLIGHLLRQGQVNPNETIPFLLALQGDVEEDDIRSLALKLLMTEGEKRQDMLRQRVCAGVKQAYLFQKTVYPDLKEVSAQVRVKENGIMQTKCVFGAVFKEVIGNNRNQRQGLFRNLLSLFDLQNRKGRDAFSTEEEYLTVLPLLSFTSQVLALLPYSFAGDPLYIIHYISSFLALQGADLLDRFAAFLRPYGLSSSDAMDEVNTEEDALEIAAKRKLPRRAKEARKLLGPDFDTKAFSNLCSEAGSLTLLLRLKAFLRKAYGLSESRCLGYNPEIKERVPEKTISKASLFAFDSKLPMQASYGGEDMTDVDRMIHQYAEFRQLMRAETRVEVSIDDSDDEGLVRMNKKKRALSEDEEDDDIDDEMIEY